MQDYLSDLATWQQQIGKRDHALRQKKVVVKEKQGGSPATTTPSEAPKASSLSPSTSTAATAPPPRSAAVPVEREELERQDGNKAFEAGNFSEAVKCYTRALSLNPRLALVFSNRAMAYLRLKVWAQCIAAPRRFISATAMLLCTLGETRNNRNFCQLSKTPPLPLPCSRTMSNPIYGAALPGTRWAATARPWRISTKPWNWTRDIARLAAIACHCHFPCTAVTLVPFVSSHGGSRREWSCEKHWS